MKLSAWAKRQGISYRAAWNQFHKGQLPVPAKQLPTGTIVIEDPDVAEKVVIYARVSSHDQKNDLDGQVARCLKFAAQKHLKVDDSVTEIGSGMNGSLKKLVKLLRDPTVTHIIVEHRDRLMRFGGDFVEAALGGRGAKLVVVDDSERDDDLVQDMISIMTSFCARLYGRRSARNRAQKAVTAAMSE